MPDPNGLLGNSVRREQDGTITFPIAFRLSASTFSAHFPRTDRHSTSRISRSEAAGWLIPDQHIDRGESESGGLTGNTTLTKGSIVPSAPATLSELAKLREETLVLFRLSLDLKAEKLSV
jgi:hypothetical protein